MSALDAARQKNLSKGQELARQKAVLVSPEERAARIRETKRLSAQRRRAADPERARRERREQMATYGPEYRRRWNHYNRLRRAKQPGPDALAREYVLIIQKDPCCYCGSPMEHIDHIVPIMSGGPGTWDNLTPACASCNLRKQKRSLLIFLLSLHL